ncbi:MAG: aminoglycoside adenylyltransferase domain-containing protein [Fusicatenibacter sp.]|nr:DUF4111 domain-containing protein [Fusicatenibacter sp.]
MNCWDLIGEFTRRTREILGENLTGVYLHGSLAMGCFNPKKSDIDLLTVVKHEIPGEVKRQYMDLVVEMNGQAPEKGIELSVVQESVCRPFVYPTPFELHFSITHLLWYQTDPGDYIERMKGTDKDLAAHFTILLHRGKTLYGKEIREVFSEVEKSSYFDSIWCDIENAETEIMDHPMYLTLNLCRVLAYGKEERILSKEEGGKWGLKNLPEKYRNLVMSALNEYRTGNPMNPDGQLAEEYARYMVQQIQKSAAF